MISITEQYRPIHEADGYSNGGCYNCYAEDKRGIEADGLYVWLIEIQMGDIHTCIWRTRLCDDCYPKFRESMQQFLEAHFSAKA